MHNPSLPHNLPAWLDQVEAYCGDKSMLGNITFTVKAEHDPPPIAIQVIRGLVQAVSLYRLSHPACISTEPQGLCNKCSFAEKALAIAALQEVP